MKAILKIVLINFYLLAISFSGFSQDKNLDKQILSIFSSDDKKEIANAEKIRWYGDELMKDALSIEESNDLIFKGRKDYRLEKIRQMDD